MGEYRKQPVLRGLSRTLSPPQRKMEIPWPGMMYSADRHIWNIRMGNGPMLNKQPEIVVFAGPNGSGKSTFTTPQWIKGTYINADDITRELGITNLEAAIRADELREKLIRCGATFTFETVLSRPDKLDFLQRAKESGYFIRGYFVLTCDPNLNAARVQARVHDGGHDVPKEAIIRRYKKSLENIPRFVRICDICHVYDNTVEPFRLCRKHKDSITLFESELWPYEKINRLIFGDGER